MVVAADADPVGRGWCGRRAWTRSGLQGLSGEDIVVISLAALWMRQGLGLRKLDIVPSGM